MEEKGVWRTVRGRRIFIKEGQNLRDAMEKSGKFKNLDKTSKGEISEEARKFIGEEIDKFFNLMEKYDLSFDDFMKYFKKSNNKK